MGMLLLTIGVRITLNLSQMNIVFFFGKEIVRSTIVPDRVLAMSMGGDASKLNGIPTIEPVFGIQAMWIPKDERRNAEIEGCTVVDPASVLVTHLADALKNSSYLILEREGTQRLLDLIKDKNPTLVSELLPIWSMLALFKELAKFIKGKFQTEPYHSETIADMANITKNPDDL